MVPQKSGPLKVQILGGLKHFGLNLGGQLDLLVFVGPETHRLASRLPCLDLLGQSRTDFLLYRFGRNIVLLVILRLNSTAPVCFVNGFLHRLGHLVGIQVNSRVYISGGPADRLYQ